MLSGKIYIYIFSLLGVRIGCYYLLYCLIVFICVNVEVKLELNGDLKNLGVNELSTKLVISLFFSSIIYANSVNFMYEPFIAKVM